MIKHLQKICIVDFPYETLCESLQKLTYDCGAVLLPCCEDPMQALKRSHPSMIVMDAMHRASEKLMLCRRIHAIPSLRHIPVILHFSEPALYVAMRGQCRTWGAKPVYSRHLLSLLPRLQSILKRYAAYNRQGHAQLQWTCLYAASNLAISIDDHGGHLLRTRFLFEALAELALSSGTYPGILTKEGIQLMSQAAAFHDIGKLAIDPSILQKPGKLTKEDFAIVKTHTTLARDALLQAHAAMGGTAQELQHTLDVIYCHHERWDGSGYPQGLCGEEIPVPARLMAIADVYDALTSKRVYKRTLSHEKAANYILAQSGKQFDPRAVELFAQLRQTFYDICTYYSDPVGDIDETR